MTISSVTSEALQLKLRQLLPSQQGFGTDLSASDTIIPVIDLTTAAEGSDVSQNLQTALGFGSQTAISSTNSTVAIANTTGFYRVTGVCSGRIGSSTGVSIQFQMTDGSSTKTVWGLVIALTTTVDVCVNEQIDQTFWLNAGETLQVVTNSVSNFTGSARQIATSTGDLVQPSGFSPQ